MQRLDGEGHERSRPLAAQRGDEFVTFDKAAFSEALISSAQAGGQIPEQVVSCLQTALDQASEEQLQSAYLSGDEQQLVGLFGSCFGG